jgi:FkbM family methyltransferase
METPWFVRYWLARDPAAYRLLGRLTGRFSPERLVLMSLVRAGDVVLDVGANRGYLTTIFSHIVGSKGQVHGFEASPTTFAMLQDYVKSQQRFANVKLVNAAVGDSAGVTTLYMPDEDDGQASLRHQQNGSWQAARKITPIQCTMVRLDDYLSSNGFGPVSFVKCDVEGAELMVFRGGLSFLRDQQPLIFCEVCADWTSNFGYRASDLVGLLQSVGYDRFYVVDDDGSAVLRPIEIKDVDALSGSHDLVCGVLGKHDVRVRSSRLLRIATV